MKSGIKKKLLLVLVGSLVLTTALHAVLTSYFTNRQNEDAAFALLELDLLAWQNELHELTRTLRDGALAAVGDGVMLNHLTELTALEFGLEDALEAEASRETARTLAYLKSVSINRFHLVLRTGGFSSVSIYVRGRLSHHVSAHTAGMMIQPPRGGTIWVGAQTDAKGNLPTSAWPAWQVTTPSPARSIAPVDRPTVSFDFSAAEGTTLEIAVPVQGVFEEVLTDADVRPRTRIVSDAAIAGLGPGSVAYGPAPTPQVFAVVVFRKVIGPAELEKVAARTGKLPALYSPTGTVPQYLAALGLPPRDTLLELVAARSTRLGPAPAWHGIVDDDAGSYYAALRAWDFEGRPALILGLAASRAPVLENIRQTVAAILVASGLILLLSLAAGMLLVGRLINPVVALTTAVKAIGAKRPSGAGAADSDRHALEALQPVAIEAPDEVGELTRAFNKMIRELRTTLETLEQRVLDRTAELRQQTSYLRALIDTLPLMVWLKDTDGRYLTINQANAKACGYAVDEMIGKTDAQLWPGERAERYLAQDAEIIASRKARTSEEAIRAGGHTIWLETTVAPVLDDDETVLGTVGAARDISERKTAEAAREKALAEAERLARLRSEFLAQMSHELRTPLNGILGYAQLLKRDKTLDDKQLESVNVIQQSGEHLLTLINDILDLAKIEAGRLELYPSDFDLGQFLLVIAEIVRVKAEEKGLAFVCRLAPQLPARVRADEKRLRQVLLNLLANAVKFTEHGEVRFSASFVPPGRLRFEVRDTGIGIAADQQEAIFQPFEQAGDPSQRIAGAGLGLAISRQFVRLMGGDIQVDSHVGGGSTFWFEIEVPVMAFDLEQTGAEGVIKGYRGPRKSVLVIDDVEANRRLVVDMLLPLGFEVREAADGQQGLAQARLERPDIVLMDVVMPKMDGLESTRRMRAEPVLADLPVIAMSARASGGDEEKARGAGANTFLPKPLDLGRLLTQIGRLLRLEWTYDEAPDADAPTACRCRVALVPPPPDELKILHELVLQGNMRDILRHAEHVANLGERYQPFAAQLRRLAEGYQSKALAALVEQYLDGRSAP